MKKTIIIVEDNEKNMKLFEDILSLFSEIEIIKEKNGDRGYELIKKSSPDLIILDIHLPGMDGTEICKKLRTIKKFKDVPILAVTSFAMSGDKERILEAGFNEYIPKPIRIKEFREIIKQNLNI